MKGYVSSVTLSSTKKSYRVKIGDTFYGASLDSKIDGAMGRNIDFTHAHSDFGPWIESWGPDHTQPSPPPSQAPVAPPARTSGVSNGDRWWLPFCSNQIAHLIQVGVIKDKASLNQWAKDLKDCVVALDSHDSIPF